MKPKKKSQPPNAKARGASNSKAARSRPTAEKKSRKFKSGEEVLRVATPSKWLALQREGLIAPEELDPNDESVPLDLTQPSSRAIGAIHSRFAVRHAYALFALAKIKSGLVRNRRELRRRQAIFRARNSGDYKNKYSIDDAMEQDPAISKLLNRIMKHEIEAELVEAVLDGYEDIRNAASREMSRRDSERPSRD